MNTTVYTATVLGHQRAATLEREIAILRSHAERFEATPAAKRSTRRTALTAWLAAHTHRNTLRPAH